MLNGRSARFFAVLILVTLVGCTKGNQDKDRTGSQEITIGFGSPLTGPQANYGLMCLRGAELRFSEINAVNQKTGGPHYTLLRGDDQATPSQAVVVAQEFASNGKLAVVLGHFNSSCTLAGQKIYDAAKLPNISYGSTNDDIGKGSIWTFRTPYKNSLQGRTLARYASAHNLTRVAILAENEDYGRGLADVFKVSAAELNFKIVAERSYSSDTTDFRPLFLGLSKAKPDAILLAGFYPQLQVAAAQAREIGVKAVFLAGDGVGSSVEYIKNAGAAAEGTVATGPFLIENDRESVQEFKRKFQQRYKQEPDSWAVYAYDAAGLVDQVVSAAGKDHEAIRKALAGINSREKAYSGLVGPIWFDKNRDAVNDDVSLAIVKGGRYVVIPAQ
jgi:branched-chain amino acid transport system substrate-binding protein